MGLKYINQNGEEVIIAEKGKNGKDGKDGGVSTGSVIGWTGEEIPEGYEEVDSSLLPSNSGVEVGTIVHIDKSATTPEGWQDVTDEDKITLVDPSELFTISEGFTLLFDSNIYKHRNRYFGDITIQKDEGNFDEWGNTVATFKKTMIGMCNTGCFLCAGQWNTNVVGHCFIGATEISVANKTGVNNYNVAKIKFDVVSNETNATKPIEKKSATPIEPKTGHIFNGTNIEDKTTNTYSAEIIDGLIGGQGVWNELALNGDFIGQGKARYTQIGKTVIVRLEDISIIKDFPYNQTNLVYGLPPAKDDNTMCMLIGTDQANIDTLRLILSGDTLQSWYSAKKASTTMLFYGTFAYETT